MAWIKVPGLAGKVYVPDGTGNRKHPCGNCFACQWCDESRCRVCRADGKDTESPPTEKRCAGKSCPPS